MISVKEEQELLELLEAENLYQVRRKIWKYYPEPGPIRRELYQKHQEFLES